jgi:hypothetical protein
MWNIILTPEPLVDDLLPGFTRERGRGEAGARPALCLYLLRDLSFQRVAPSRSQGGKEVTSKLWEEPTRRRAIHCFLLRFPPCGPPAGAPPLRPRAAQGPATPSR